jgi:hypothetical protein
MVSERNTAQTRPSLSMKIILSRKGFDSRTGKRPSFITSSGDLVSLPIPDRYNAQHKTTYQKVNTPLGLLGTILPAINARTKDRPSQPILGGALAHLDPDLWRCSLPRAGTWGGAYGPRTTGGVNILIEQKVGPGDLFLFFGWFKKLSQTFPDSPPYQHDAPDLHVVFGYLQVDAVYNNAQIPQLLQRYSGLIDHPHVCAPRTGNQMNRIFVARQTLALPGVSIELPGAGVFGFDPKRVLTRNGVKSRTQWLLRGIGTGSNAQPPFVRRAGKFMNWKKVGCDWEVTDFGRGQEFIIDSSFPGALPWARSFF